MGLLDSLLTKALTEEKEIQKKTKEKTAVRKTSAGKAVVKELAVKLAEIERQEGALEEKRKNLNVLQKKLDKERIEIEDIKKKEIVKLEKIAKLTRKKAKELLLEATEKHLAEDIARKIKEGEEKIKETVEEGARELLVEAMQHGVTDCVAEYTVSSVQLPNEELKGRVIGREGRNIRAFERATGVEIELGDSNDIILSSFDPVRREVAKRALQKLIRDQRIQPARIKEVVEQTKKEVEKIVFEEGRKLCHSLKVYQLHTDLIKLLGRFKFRFSYGQNMITHTLEETKIGIQIAHEVGANVSVVRLGCLLHDIGKVVTDSEGTHVQLGVELAKKHRLPKEVITCIAEHHEDKPFSSIESRIVWIADAISGSRPGARYEPHENYVKRMEDIEEIANKNKGVKEAFAYQAGRDVRVMVKPEEVSDNELVILANKIAKELEEKVSYAGQIKVTCIRETTASESTKAK